MAIYVMDAKIKFAALLPHHSQAAANELTPRPQSATSKLVIVESLPSL